VRRLVAVSCFVLAAASLVGRSAIAEPGCGSGLAVSFTLSHDIGECPTGGFEITASNVVLNLNGFKIFGTDSTGDGNGVTIDSGVSNVVIENGTITAFDEGIFIANGVHHVTISHVHVLGNVGDGSLTGDGIYAAPASSDHIVVTHSDIENNGPFTGVTISGTDSALTSSTVIANAGYGAFVETATATVHGNTIRNSSEWGLYVSATDVHITANHILDNGYATKNGGIGIVGPGAVVKHNVVTYNAGSGIKQFNTDGHFVSNTATKNGISGSGFDLEDINVGCTSNVWHNNTFKTRSQTCIH
jgi:hypothetical protein